MKFWISSLMIHDDFTVMTTFTVSAASHKLGKFSLVGEVKIQSQFPSEMMARQT